MKITTLTARDQLDQTQRVLVEQAQRLRSLVLIFTDLLASEQRQLQQILRHFNLVFDENQQSITAIVDDFALGKLLPECQRFFTNEAYQQLVRVQDDHRMIWHAGNYQFDVTTQGLVYAILNTTPDSFYDGGDYFDEQAVRQHVAEMLHHGADIIEVGGQSTRPGYQEISSATELERIMPVIELIHHEFPEAIIAVDTYKPEVMARVIEAGVSIINDINGFVDDPEKLKLMQASTVGMVSMLNRRLMTEPITYTNVIEVFSDQLKQFVDYGIDLKRVVLDPGVGFSTVGNLNNDLALIHGVSQLNQFHLPVMAAVSNKSYLKKLLGLDKTERVTMSLVTEALMYLQGNQILRVHNVEETDQMRRLIDRIQTSYLE